MDASSLPQACPIGHRIAHVHAPGRHQACLGQEIWCPRHARGSPKEHARSKTHWSSRSNAFFLFFSTFFLKKGDIHSYWILQSKLISSKRYRTLVKTTCIILKIFNLPCICPTLSKFSVHKSKNICECPELPKHWTIWHCPKENAPGKVGAVQCPIGNPNVGWELVGSVFRIPNVGCR